MPPQEHHIDRDAKLLRQVDNTLPSRVRVLTLDRQVGPIEGALREILLKTPP